MGERVAVKSELFVMEDQLRQQGLLAEDVAAYRPNPGDLDFFMNYENKGIPGASRDDWSAVEADYKVKFLLLAAYQRMFDLFETDASDQSQTYWPVGPNGTRLTSHEAVVESVNSLIDRGQDGDVKELTQFLYQLREFDRTRSLSPELAERLRSYRLSQAIWAGQAEYQTWDVKFTGIDPEPSLIVLPLLLSDSTDDKKDSR